MIEHLEIENYALIENLSIDFSEGFNVITGETGAGKSIILGAMGLLMGEKADTRLIRSGSHELSVNAVLSIPQNHEALSILNNFNIRSEDSQIIIRRTIRENGRSLISVQGKAISRTELSQLADSLIDLHGQGEHQSLLKPSVQQRILDSYSKTEKLKALCSDFNQKINELEKQLEQEKQNFDNMAKQKEYFKYALDEIESASLKTDEDAELKEKIALCSERENIMSNCSFAEEKLKECTVFLFDACSAIAKSAKTDTSLKELSERLETQRIELQDIAQSVNSHFNSYSFDEYSLDMLQERLQVVQKLKRKYGPEIQNVLDFAKDAQEKLLLLENSDEYIKKIKAELEDLKIKYHEVASKLSAERKKSATVLENSICCVLRTLGMPDAVFKIEVSYNDSIISSSGSDSVVFTISANKGEDTGNLNSVASGGELSRIMLALKTVLAEEDLIQTQIFDEIDSGIGGAVALSLAKNLKKLSKTKQVIAVTHLAGVASVADRHFVVSKYVKDGRTFTKVNLCKDEERIHEIARMLSGDESNVTLIHAQQMLKPV